MSTKKSEAVKFIEKVAGKSLSIGSFLEAIRLGEDKTLEEFAKKLKLSRSHLCDIEKGRKAVSAARAAQFAKILRHSEAQFVRLALQDEVERAGLHMKIKVEVA